MPNGYAEYALAKNWGKLIWLILIIIKLNLVEQLLCNWQ